MSLFIRGFTSGFNTVDDYCHGLVVNSVKNTIISYAKSITVFVGKFLEPGFLGSLAKELIAWSIWALCFRGILEASF